MARVCFVAKPWPRRSAKRSWEKGFMAGVDLRVVSTYLRERHALDGQVRPR